MTNTRERNGTSVCDLGCNLEEEVVGDVPCLCHYVCGCACVCACMCKTEKKSSAQLAMLFWEGRELK